MATTQQQTRAGVDSTAARRPVQDDARGGAAKTPQEKWKIPPGRTWLWFVVALLLNFLLTRFLMPGPEAPVTVPYTVFKQEVGKRNV
ncbi:MAG TPA: cell division protein FtsH, partial [Candidatus Binatia bacterium]|nr:cell division protein FtsH [Candidatus Binatia bacterium]